jgi:transcriptional regulator with XRE-family HTH domain
MLQDLRKKAGLSQSGLARKAGLPVRSIQNWEQGHRLPKGRAVVTLAEALGVRPQDLFLAVAEQWIGRPEPKPGKGKPKKGGR